MNNFLHRSQSSSESFQENETSISNNSQSTLSKTTYDALILDARSRQSLVAVRSLGSRGISTAAFESFDGLPVPAFSSRWCQHKVICPEAVATQEYLACLEQVLDSTEARVLIPSSDITIALISKYRERIEQRVRLAVAKESALSIAINKERTLEVAKRLGLSVPRGVNVSGVCEVKSALREIGLPAVIKPVESWMWSEQHGMRVQSLLVTNLEEAQRAVEKLTIYGKTTLFQQFLPGRRDAMSFIYAHGQIYARFAQWAKRTNPPLGGTSVVRQSISVPEDIGEQAERLIREIELEGYSEVEFRRDRGGHPYLMEINPRLSASVGLAVQAGVDFPYLLYQWANGGRIDVVNTYRTGIWMRYLGGDVATTIAAVRQRGRPGVPPPAIAILAFCVSFFIPMYYDYINWKDPFPMLAAIIGFPRYLLRGEDKRLSKQKSS